MAFKLSENFVYTAICLSPFLAYLFYAQVARRSKLPPSPPSDPIVGHVLRVPQDYAWKTFASWKKKYGDVIYLHFFGSPMIVLDSITAARDLLDKRSAKYSGRPRSVVIGEMLGWSTSLPFLDYGDRSKRQRRLMQRYFDAQSVKAFSGIQRQGVQLYLENILQDPEDFRGAAQRLVASVVLRATYGYSALPRDDPLTDLLHRAVTSSSEILSIGGNTIELLPFLRHVPSWLPSWIPGVTGKRLAIKARETIYNAITSPFEELKSQKAAGTAEPSLVSKLLDDYEEERREVDDLEMLEDIKMLGGITYTAGFESTWATILTFFLMMTLNQDVQKRAQEEIDRVIGTDRLPTSDDRERLPYIHCILKETFRINPIFAQGLAHTTTEADRYRDWDIPKGALISPNIWQMMRDEEYFQEPHVFSPERYLQKSDGSVSGAGDGGIDQVVVNDVDPGYIVFGFGRRICPGRFFAERSLWLTFASTLAAFDIKPIVDPVSGKELPPVADYVETLTSFPKPFKCTITPRSEKHAMLIREGLT